MFIFFFSMLFVFPNFAIPENMNCRLKSGCNINRCDPFHQNQQIYNIDEYLKRNEFPITCEMTRETADTVKIFKELGTLKEEIAALKRELRKSQQVDKEQDASITEIKRDLETMKQNITNDLIEEGQLRLVNGNSHKEGRVEIYYNKEWGTICDDGWDMDDAHAVCRTLDFRKARDAPKEAKFGEGSGNIWLRNVECTGDELNFSECAKAQNWGPYNERCDHFEDASVVCE